MSNPDVAAWLLALDAGSVDEGLARIDALIVESETALDVLTHLPRDLEWVPDPRLQGLARLARMYVLEIRDDLVAARRRLEA